MDWALVVAQVWWNTSVWWFGWIELVVVFAGFGFPGWARFFMSALLELKRLEVAWPWVGWDSLERAALVAHVEARLGGPELGKESEPNHPTVLILIINFKEASG